MHAKGNHDACCASIIIPVYNDEKLVSRAVESALSQTLSGVEVIVVDDGSTDGTADTLSAYEGRIILIRQCNKGVSAARNAGFAASRGRLVGFLDSDDVILPNKVAVQVAALDKSLDAGLCYGRWERMKDGGSGPAEIRSAFFAEPWPDGLAFRPPFPMNSVLFRREALELVGGFDETLWGSEDTDLWWRLALAGVGFAGVEYVVARTYPQPESLSTNPDKMLRSYLMKLDKYFHLRPSNPLKLDPDGAYAIRWVMGGALYLRSGNLTQAIEAWKKATEYDRGVFRHVHTWFLVTEKLSLDSPSDCATAEEGTPKTGPRKSNLRKLERHLSQALQSALVQKQTNRLKRSLRPERAAMRLRLSQLPSQNGAPVLARIWLARAASLSLPTLMAREHRRASLCILLGPNVVRIFQVIWRTAKAKSRWRRAHKTQMTGRIDDSGQRAHSRL